MLVYLVLLEGRSGADPLFLQCKQAGPSVDEAHLRHPRPRQPRRAGGGGQAHGAERHRPLRGLGCARWRRHLDVREYGDMKLIPTTEMIAPRLARFAAACGATLARAHARSGDPTAIDAYMGKGEAFTSAMAVFARRYAAPERARPRPPGRRHPPRGRGRHSGLRGRRSASSQRSVRRGLVEPAPFRGYPPR